ncbi:MAG: right-handed parallel beta-helix repeat-containing protein [Melioribacteraceae bacterium]|nr:right-handed parallel beta-helix repeat-containing protein [Melioribacteraceae bacterium]
MKSKAIRLYLVCLVFITSSISYPQHLLKNYEILEEILVTNTNDSGPGSLRQAIYAANNFLHVQSNIIRFNIPKTDPGYDSNRNIWVIKPSSSFEFIIDRNLIIDGFSQRAFIGSDVNPYGPEIVIDGSNAGTNTSAFVSSAEGTDIYGLVINRFDGSGILFLPPGKGTVSGCYLGTEYTGMYEVGNRFGISLLGKVVDVHIGPSEYVFPNVICGNTQTGVFLSDSASNNVIVGNNIGLNRDGTAVVPNITQGITIQNFSDNNEIVRNIIGGNKVGIFINNSNHNLFASNIIGTSESMEADYGNSDAGISIWNNSSSNSILNNIICYNNIGISVDGLASLRNLISRNNVSHNHSLGIDNRNGGNVELTPPIITNITDNEIFGESSPSHIIEIFADIEDEGIIFIDSTITNMEGNFYLYLDEMPQYPHITATARDQLGNTSEFSTPFLVSVIDGHEIPKNYYLSQNYPNPFNPNTTIDYQLPVSGHTKLTIYDLLATEIISLVDEDQSAGKYKVNFSATEFASGIYFYRLASKSSDGIHRFEKIKKLVILK